MTIWRCMRTREGIDYSSETDIGRVIDQWNRTLANLFGNFGMMEAEADATLRD